MIMTYFNKLLTALVVLLVIFASGVTMVIYWLNWPYNPLEVHSIEILNSGKTVEQGGTLAYHIKWTKHTNIQGRVSRYFVNGNKHSLDGDDGKLGSAPPGPGEADIFLPIPENNPCGRGRMQFVTAYPMNPLRVVVAPKVPAYSDEFTVVKKVVKGLKGDKGSKGDKGDKGENVGSGYTIFGDVVKGKK
jgi:hypothetical protein